MRNLIKQANDLGQKIKESPEFSAYEKCRTAYENDVDLQKLIGEYNLKRQMLIHENKKEDSEQDSSLQETLQTAMRELYDAVMSNKNMADYASAKREFETLVNDIMNTINSHISDPQEGCGGSCSSCSGCS